MYHFNNGAGDFFGIVGLVTQFNWTIRLAVQGRLRLRIYLVSELIISAGKYNLSMRDTASATQYCLRRCRWRH